MPPEVPQEEKQPTLQGEQRSPRARTADDALERAKELDFEHRSRERSVARVVLPLGFLRTFWRRLWTPTARAAAAPVPHPTDQTIAVTFVGHATVMITTAGARVLTDPMLDDSLFGLRRARAAAIDPGDLANVNLVLISHAHGDHLSRKSLRRLPRTATVVVAPNCKPLVSDLGFARVVELAAGRTFSFADLEVIGVPARHTGGRAGLGRPRPAALGYVVRTSQRAIYFAGATGYFSGFAEIGRRFDPDVALLPIGGYQPAPFRQEHLSPLDAVYAFEDLGARILIPISHGSFELGYEPISEPLTWLQSLAQERKLFPALTILDHGQTCLIR